eukprot:TRINITY_DN1132_c0_g2_i2.p1 TRINITY_DN1132_c0_g2~~TRINITY_DN1132_c0_g2_i2.p1  ORF type:complete len:144 (-),score=12.24 TRINITY_DN1132_c0_g2_i2:76-477(-)
MNNEGLTIKRILISLSVLFLLFCFFQIGKYTARRSNVPRSVHDLIENDRILTELANELEKTKAERSEGDDEPYVVTLGWNPRVQYYHNFITDDEANHIMKLVTPILTKSTVVSETGANIESNHRTSMGAFLGL